MHQTKIDGRERASRTVALQLKSLDGEGRFAGYASVFSVVDSQQDIMLRGAFRSTIRSKREIPLLWQHRQDEPIGVITALKEDANGLYVEGRLLLSVARAVEAYALLKARALKGLSIGYSPRRSTLDKASGVRRLEEVDLWEVSLVTFPANQHAEVTVVKHAESMDALRFALDRAVLILGPATGRNRGSSLTSR